MLNEFYLAFPDTDKAPIVGINAYPIFTQAAFFFIVYRYDYPAQLFVIVKHYSHFVSDIEFI